MSGSSSKMAKPPLTPIASASPIQEAIREQMAVDAESKVKVRLVLDAIAVKEALNPTEEEIEAEYQRIADMYQMPFVIEKQIEEYPVKELLCGYIRMHLLIIYLQELFTDVACIHI